jgi:amylosucrase
MSISPSIPLPALERLPEHLREAVRQRLASRGGLLRDRLERLYADAVDFPAWFARLMSGLADIHAARPDELLALDRTREQAPDWFERQTMLGYCAYADRFAGSLRGVADRIPHLQELGVTYLHLLPFLKARAGGPDESDGGFAVASYDEIEPRLGTMEDLEALTAQLRHAGISLCSDLVLNHVADDHPWAVGARNGDARLRQFFHVYPDRTVPDRFERTLVQIFPQAAPGNFTWNDAMQGWVWTTFYPYQWDLNYANPEVFAEMACALLRLANRGIEAFRLDSTAFLWKREGTNGMNQPEAHWILQALRCIVDIFAPAVLLKAEAIVPTRELPFYFGSASGEGAGHECHLAYHSSLMSSSWLALALQDTTVLREVIRGTPQLPTPASWITYVRCHDDIGWNVLRPELAQLGMTEDVLARAAQFLEGGTEDSFAAGVAFQTGSEVAVHGTNGMAASLAGFDKAGSEEERELALRRLYLMYSVALCFGGTPVIYMGDEVALTNDAPESWQSQGVVDTRWAQRPHLPAARFGERHDATQPAGRTFAGFRRLIRARSRIEALAADVPRSVIETGDPSLLALRRGEVFCLVANFSGASKSVARTRLGFVDTDRLLDCVADEIIGAGDIALGPWEARWLSSSEQMRRILPRSS